MPKKREFLPPKNASLWEEDEIDPPPDEGDHAVSQGEDGRFAAAKIGSHACRCSGQRERSTLGDPCSSR